MIVTRQSNYYDDGAFSVEVAFELDYAGPGALSRKYSLDFAENDDPREIADIAIKLRRDWFYDVGQYIPFTLSMNGAIYATVNDGMTAAGLRRWAKGVYEKMPKCDYCGDIPASEWINHEWNDKVYACSEQHAQRLADYHYEECNNDYTP